MGSPRNCRLAITFGTYKKKKKKKKKSLERRRWWRWVSPRRPIMSFCGFSWLLWIFGPFHVQGDQDRQNSQHFFNLFNFLEFLDFLDDFLENSEKLKDSLVKGEIVKKISKRRKAFCVRFWPFLST